MKKASSLLILALTTMFAMAQNGRIDLRQETKAEITKSDFSSLRATFSYGSIESIEITTERGTFSEIAIEGTYASGEIGSPELPVSHQLLAVPFGATPRVSVINYTTTDYRLSDYGIGTILPHQHSVRKDQNPDEVEFFYNAQAYQPRSLATVPEATIEVQGTMRGIRIGSLVINPVSYNPGSNTLRVFNDIKVEISFDNADRAETERMLLSTYSPYFDIVYKQMFNYRQIMDVYDDHPDLMAYPVHMIVITPQEYISVLQPWINWKIQKGFDVNVVTTAQAGSNYNAIRSYVQNLYNTGVSQGATPTFLILVGDTGQIPGETSGTATQKVTDLYYGSVDGDEFPDMFYSRMSAENTNQLTSIVNKILQYEQYTMPDPSYLSNVTLIAGWDSYWNARVGQPTINYATTYYYNAAHGFTTVNAYLQQSQYQGCYNTLNTGAGFINYTGHSTETIWSDPQFTVSNVNALTNANKYFLALGNSGFSANFGYSQPCFGEAMIRAENKAAYSYIGSCADTYWYEDYYFCVGATNVFNQTPTLENTATGVYDGIWMNDTYNTVSSMTFLGNLAVCYASTGGYQTSSDPTYYWQAYHVLGDGSIMPYRVNPTPNTVSHASSIPAGATSITVNAQAGSYVGISQNNVLKGTALVPTSGSVTVPVSGISSGQVHIVVTKPQRQPYIQDISVITNYNVSVSANPTNGGSVSGGGIYSQGASCTVSATASSGYSFFSWTENGVLVSTDPTYSFYVTENRNLVANFVPASGNKCTLVFDLYDSYGDGWNNAKLNVAFNNGLPTQHITMFSGSSASYELEVNDGAVVTLTWTPGSWDSECSFNVHYEDGTMIYQGSNLSSSFSHSFQMDCPGSTTNYTISVSANPSNGGTVTGGGTYSQGQSCNVTATNNSGFTFTNWTENGSVVSTQSSYTFTVNNNRTLVANFQSQPQSYAISVSANPTNVGTVTGGGTYQQGQSCNVTAESNIGYTFTNWTENGNVVSTQASYTFTVTGNRTLVANFTQQQFTINVTANPTNGGTVTGGGTYTYGQSCSVTATPNPNFNFINWTENGNPVSIQLSYTFTVTSNRNLVANFTTQNYIINANAYPSDGGTISGAGGYDYGQTCILTATPATGYEFINWIKDGSQVSTETSYSFTVTESALYEAHFQLQSFTINASANPEDGGSVTGGGSYYYGQTCYLEATPVSDYTFINWTKEGEFVSNQFSYSFTVTENASYDANFDKILFEITATADPINGGDVSGAGTYSYGDTCILTAAARAGFVFENWTRNDIVVSTSPSYPFQVRRNADYVAHFTMDANHCIITAMADPYEGGTVSGDGTFELGNMCTLDAIPADGYEFVNWTLELDGSQVSTNASFSFPVTGDAVYVAHFVKKYTITANVEPIGAGSIIGTGTFKEGESCTLIATPNPTYSFEKWIENGEDVSTDNPYSFAIDRDLDLVAVFFQGLFYTITASAGANGTISPSEGDVLVEPGEDMTFTMIPNSGCEVKKVLVDGVDRGPIPSHTFRNVNEDHTIHVEFSGLGLDDNTTLDLKVFPNPANDKINIQCQNMKQVSIFNLLGVQIESKDVNNDHAVLSTDNLSPGTYILKVESLDGRIGYSSFILGK